MRNVFNFYLQADAATARQVQKKRPLKNPSQKNKYKEIKIKICKKRHKCKFRTAKVFDAPEKLLKICGKTATYGRTAAGEIRRIVK